ncbi:hypothetical protein OROMI_000368 [Orobanche minor]
MKMLIFSYASVVSWFDLILFGSALSELLRLFGQCFGPAVLSCIEGAPRPNGCGFKSRSGYK